MAFNIFCHFYTNETSLIDAIERHNVIVIQNMSSVKV